MFFRKDVFSSIGGFDTVFFLYCEEEDICKRVWDFGKKVYFIPKAEVFHEAGGSTEKSFEIEEYRRILGIEKKAYPIFANFRIRVIEPTVEEISEQTELNISETKYIKTGRKITGITFVVKIRQTDETQALKMEREEEPPKEQPHPIIERLISLGFGVETAKQYKTKYGIKRIERNIAYTLAKKQEGIVKDIPPYLNKAIVEDMGGGWEVMQSKQNQEKAEQQAQAAKREQAAELAHLKTMAERAGVPLEDLLPKKAKGGN
jgi:hypothetical protein